MKSVHIHTNVYLMFNYKAALKKNPKKTLLKSNEFALPSSNSEPNSFKTILFCQISPF